MEFTPKLHDYNAHSTHIFAIPLFEHVLIYAPLQQLAAFANQPATEAIRQWMSGAREVPSLPAISNITSYLDQPVEAPAPRQSEFIPTMLGILPTRGCNFACQYCGFLTPEESRRTMSRGTAQNAVAWYMGEIEKHQLEHAKIHFFGGEPLYAPHIVEYVVEQARRHAQEIGCTVEFEVTTNGAFSEARCVWVGNNIDSVVLSFDGPADVQNLHRPFRNGSASFNTVYRNAKYLSDGPAQLCLRACVTAATAPRMPEIAAWFCAEFNPAIVSFEPLQLSSWAQTDQLRPPDPWEFARYFVDAARVLEAHGIPIMYAAADISAQHVTFCPVGDDAVIVAPDGSANACYLLPREWEVKGLDLQLGHVIEIGIEIDSTRLNRVRKLNVLNKPFCEKCFCKWHCAGGCHVNHMIDAALGEFDRLCIQTRIIALYNILHALDQDELAYRLLNNRAALEQAVLQGSDLLMDKDRSQ